MENDLSILVKDLPPAALIGECLMPRLQIEQFISEEEYRAGITKLVREHKAGGFCVFGGTPETVVSTIRSLQSSASASHGVPLIFSADCEFGLPMRLTSGGTEFPDAMAIGRTGDPELARQAGRAIAREMKSLGITWNFAPVADVNSNPANPIINTRSFGEDPATVSRFAVPFMFGLEEEGVAAAAKHFPGHGDTSVDSHRELPFVNGGWGRFSTTALPPFQALVDSKIRSVMLGHLAAPDLAEYLGALQENWPLPATFSPTLISALLRERMGFRGIVVTDALEMRAVTNLFGEAEAILRSFEAGVDVLLLPPDPELAFEALSDAFASGRITIEQLREKVARIMALKKFATIEVGSISPEKLLDLEKEHSSLSRTIAEQALEFAGKIDLSNANLIVLADDRPQAVAKAEAFLKMAGSLFSSVKLLRISDLSNASLDFDGNSVLATFHRARGYIGGDATNTSMPRIMAHIAENMACKGTVLRGLILFGSPYLGREFKTEPGFILRTFSESSASVEAVWKRLSVTINT